MQRLPDVMAWLDAGVPLTLVMDLLNPSGPSSARISRQEQPEPSHLDWLSAFTGHLGPRTTAAPSLT